MTQNSIGADAIRDRELRESAKKAEEAFRENNTLPQLGNLGVTVPFMPKNEFDKCENDFLAEEKRAVSIEAQEDKIIENALNPSKPTRSPVNHGYVKLPFTTVKALIHDLKALFPAAINLMLVQPNVRDSEGAPFMLQRKLKQPQITTTVTSSRYSGTHVSVNGCWKEVYAYVEYPFVYVKIANVNIGDGY
jgi:hypothetical protein